LVGLPNVGKSTLFNALVRAQLAQASNFPFTTIKPNIADAYIVDRQLEEVAKIAGSVKTIPWSVSIKDIAGLIEGASKGAGLGNAFLADIRESSAIIQVVRCFDDPGVIHVNNAPNPSRDISIIESELILSDLQSLERLKQRKKPSLEREAELHSDWADKLIPLLEAGFPARVLEHTVHARDVLSWKKLNLLTQKPTLFVGNVGESDMKRGGNALTEEVTEVLKDRVKEYTSAVPGFEGNSSKNQTGFFPVCAKVEAELVLLEDERERQSYLEEYELKKSGLEVLLSATSDILGLHAYYTSGPQETRAWAIPRGATLPMAAGAIHSDMERGFISGDVISANDFLQAGGEKPAKALGKVRNEGKEYIVRQGDICLFKFKAPTK